MPLTATPFADLPVNTEESWDPGGVGKVAILNEVLGEDDWERYRKAHLIWDPEIPEVKGGYRLPVARMVDGRLTVISRQLGAAIAAINGARGGITAPESTRRAAFDNALRYLAKAGVEEDDMPSFKADAERRVSVSTVELDATGLDIDQPKWQHVATAGRYDGYGQGEWPFEFTADTFAEMVRNFRQHPSYRMGPNGIGVADVIAWDFHHASEASATDGTIPITGAPAQGWVLDLQVRHDRQGVAQLWALTRWLPLAKDYIKNGQYKWASVSSWLNAVDPKTGKHVGAMITSIAMTNTPFIEGMMPLAADKHAAAKATCSMMEGESGPEQAVRQMRSLFNLRETDGIPEIMAEVSRLRQWVETGQEPMGVDVEHLIARLRAILALPTLSTTQEVLEEASRLTAALIREQSTETQILPDYDPGLIIERESGALASASTPKGDETMPELLTSLAEAFGVRAEDKVVLESAKDSSKLREELRGKLNLQAGRDTNKAILAAVNDAIESRAHLSDIHESLGVKSQGDAVKALSTLLTKCSEYDAAKPELDALRERLANEEKVKAETDVDEAMRAYKIPETVKTALMRQRIDHPEEFASAYPKLDPTQIALTGQVVTETKSEKLDADPAKSSGLIDLGQYGQKNPMANAIAHIRATVHGAGKWSHFDVCREASRLLRSDKVKRP